MEQNSTTKRGRFIEMGWKERTLRFSCERGPVPCVWWALWNLGSVALYSLVVLGRYYPKKLSDDPSRWRASARRVSPSRVCIRGPTNPCAKFCSALRSASTAHRFHTHVPRFGNLHIHAQQARVRRNWFFLTWIYSKNILSTSCYLHFENWFHQCVLRNETNKIRSHLHMF